MNLTYTINENDNYKTVKDVIINHFKISHRLLIKLKTNNYIYINNSPCKINDTVKPKDLILVFIDYDEDNSNIVSNKMDLDIVYEDDSLLIVNKKPGIPVHPSSLHYTDSLSNGIKYYFDNINLNKKIRPVNRIDKNTSGLVIFSKNEYIQECLVRQMKSKEFVKEYIAIVEGTFEKDKQKGTINFPIARKENSIIERCINKNGDPSITDYEVLKQIDNKDLSVVKCILETGRTHQIRVHMSYIDHPLLGDTLYNSNNKTSNIINRQALHSYKISFIHPISNIRLDICSDLPEDLKNLI